MTSPPGSLTASSQGVSHLLYLGDHFGYPSGVAHGVTTYLRDVLPVLQDAGVTLTLCFLREPHPAAAPLRARGLAPVFLSASPWNPLVVCAVARVARQTRCGMIHAAGIKATLVARIVGWMLGIPVLVHVHDQIMPSWLIRILNRMVSRRTDYCVGVSAATGDVAMRGYYVPAERIQVIHNGIPLDRVRRIPSDARQRQRDALSLPPQGKLVAMVARLYPIKGPLSMIRMWPRIRSLFGDATLLMVGDGPEREACDTLAAESGRSARARFLGHRGDVPEILAAADLVVMPSVSEGLPLAAMEALAAGRPVVAYVVGGVPEVIRDGVDGLCVPVGDESAFAAGAADLLADDARRQRFGASAYEGAERFSLDRHVDAMLECYARVSGGRDAVPA